MTKCMCYKLGSKVFCFGFATIRVIVRVSKLFRDMYVVCVVEKCLIALKLSFDNHVTLFVGLQTQLKVHRNMELFS